MTTALIPHWTDGARFEGASKRRGDVTNPATGEVTGQVALAGAEDA
jgi:malonate-semialdehyde dehydrogenase (acetylating)/methylmalonate-semialdehyde dehydrogenase